MISNNDLVNVLKKYKEIDDSLQYGVCTTGASTAAKTVTMSNFKLRTGATVHVHFADSNTAASPTLNINSTGAKSIYCNGAAISSAYYWSMGELVAFVYDGTNWQMADKMTPMTDNEIDALFA